MPDNSKAAFWFSKVAVQRFKIQAAAKKYQIKECNEKILLAAKVDSHSDQYSNGNLCHNCQSSIALYFFTRSV